MTERPIAFTMTGLIGTVPDGLLPTLARHYNVATILGKDPILDPYRQFGLDTEEREEMLEQAYDEATEILLKGKSITMMAFLNRSVERAAFRRVITEETDAYPVILSFMTPMPVIRERLRGASTSNTSFKELKDAAYIMKENRDTIHPTEDAVRLSGDLPAADLLRIIFGRVNRIRKVD